jgi:NTE family protein
VKNSAQNALLVSVLLGLIGCSHSTNPRLVQYDPRSGYRYENLRAPGNSESLFVILTFSGGGTRAAALAYGVMEKLRDIKIMWEGEERRLLDEVDLISSVSGGSFPAAYYGLFREEIFDPEKFEKVFLYRNIQGKLIASLFNPINWFRAAAPTFGRIELAAELYDREIFRGMKFSALINQVRPFVFINATDISAGSLFTFTQDQFDLLCSDLSGVSVASAIAASSDFPIAFNSLTLENYAGSCGFKERLWLTEALRDYLVNPDRFRRAEVVRSYLNSTERKYIHLLDGGISDNIGLRGPMLELFSNDSASSVLNKINQRMVKYLVVIVVDAHTYGKNDFDKKRGDLGLFTTIDRIASIPIASYSTAMVQEFFNNINSWHKDELAYSACKKLLENVCPIARIPSAPGSVETFGIHVTFDRINNEKERSDFLSMPTTFYLPKEDVDRLRKIGPRILDESEEFQKLCAKLKCH